MRTYTYLFSKGLICLFLSLFAIGLQAQSTLKNISTTAIEAGFDNDIFTNMPNRREVKNRFEKYVPAKELKTTDPQSYSDFLNKGGVGIPINKSLIRHETKIETYNENRFPVSIPKHFSGYKIEILHTMEKIQEDNPIFFKHGRVAEEQLDDQSYAYLVGSFDSEEEADKFNKKIILENYPDAKIVKYKDGKRE